jgi:transcriptional regulator with XRE-family HTH domain
VNKSTINQIERGRRSPNIETLEKLADALGTEMGDFFPKGQASLPDFGNGERREEEGSWKAAYEKFGSEIFAQWENELEEKMALADSNPAAFLIWVKKVKDIGNPYVVNLTSAYLAAEGEGLDALLGVAPFMGRWRDLWHRIGEVTRMNEEDEKRLKEWIEESTKIPSFKGNA